LALGEVLVVAQEAGDVVQLIVEAVRFPAADVAAPVGVTHGAAQSHRLLSEAGTPRHFLAAPAQVGPHVPIPVVSPLRLARRWREQGGDESDPDYEHSSSHGAKPF